MSNDEVNCNWLQSSFLQPDGSQPSHKTFMSLLSNIENIIVRATYDTAMDSSALRDLSLDSSTTRRNGQSQVTTVEICTCPVGYAGLSCQVSGVDFYSLVLLIIINEISTSVVTCGDVFVVVCS
jgi:hypothetical protein